MQQITKAGLTERCRSHFTPDTERFFIATSIINKNLRWSNAALPWCFPGEMGTFSFAQLCHFSGTEPRPLLPWHHKMDRDKLPKVMQGNDWWAKCDCLASVSFVRLDRIKAGKCPNTGKRLYDTPAVCKTDLFAIKVAVMNHLGMSDLISAPT
jgi:hypothetical protein